MNTVKHTPGPWKCYPVNSMTCNNNRTFEIHGFETNQSVRDVLPTEVEANAKLIAAAPELLEALKHEMYILSENLPAQDDSTQMFYKGQIDRMMAAIKKATE